ncbi:glycosyltransferase family 2 protein [Desulfosarcina alkanivorans]|nr:glycosyltransferase family 2 protein [Desulfosarcina alkanivorans]
MKIYSAPVSVIIPCFRCQYTLRRALLSIEHQTVQPTEIIIINDGNTLDETKKLSKVCMDSALSGKIVTIHFPCQKGPSAARNEGWNAATQDYIAFLDADDAWHPRKLEIQYQWMTKNSDIAISGHQIVETFSSIRTPVINEGWHVRKIRPLKNLIANQFKTSTVMLRRTIGLRFDPEKRHSEDYLLWLETIFNGNKGVFISLPLAFAFKALYGDGGLSGNLWKMEKGEIDTYIKLYQKGFITILMLNGLIVLSLMKFIKRFLFYKLVLQRSRLR